MASEAPVPVTSPGSTAKGSVFGAILRGRQQSTDRPEQHNTLINPVLPMRADSVKSFQVLSEARTAPTAIASRVRGDGSSNSVIKRHIAPWHVSRLQSKGWTGSRASPSQTRIRTLPIRLTRIRWCSVLKSPTCRFLKPLISVSTMVGREECLGVAGKAVSKTRRGIE